MTGEQSFDVFSTAFHISMLSIFLICNDLGTFAESIAGNVLLCRNMSPECVSEWGAFLRRAPGSPFGRPTT